MKYALSLSDSSLSECGKVIRENLGKIKNPVQNAMATRYQQIVRSNFGTTGIDRPRQWALLSPAYARKVKRKVATLHVTGRLKAAIKKQNSSGSNPARVFATDADVPYATAHQFGSAKNHLPARPFFPMKSDGSTTPFTFGEMMRIAKSETQNRL